VIAVDTNILVYAHRIDSGFYAEASAAVRSLAEGADAWAIPWPCLHEFYSVATNPRVYVPASTSQQASAQISSWLSSPSIVLLSESDSHWSTLASIIAKSKIAGGQVHDARIAALCLQHGVRELWTADRDFSRYADLKTKNPLAN
jgi:uncharacterized protein